MPSDVSAKAGVGAYRDARGDDRWMRLTWHPGHQMFVMSIWRDDVCAATFQMRRGTSADVIGDLVRALGAPVEVAWTEPRTLTRAGRARAWLSSAERHLHIRQPRQGHGR